MLLTSLASGPQVSFFLHHTNKSIDTYLAIDYEYDDRIAGGKENDKGPREVNDIDIFWVTGIFFFHFIFNFANKSFRYLHKNQNLGDQHCMQEGMMGMRE